MASWLIDFDSTLNTLDENQVRSVNQKFGCDYKVEDVTSWGFWRSLENRDHADYVWCDETFHSKDWTLNLGIQPDAAEIIKLLHLDDHKLVIVSDRDMNHRPWVVEWLAKHDLTKFISDVIITDKRLFPKSQVAEALNLTFAIEDAVHNIEGLALVPTMNTVFVMDKPWNRLPFYPNTKRVHSWKEIYGQ